MFWPDAVIEIAFGTGPDAYPYDKKAQMQSLLDGTWEYLRREGLIMPAPDQNGRNGYMILTKDGEKIGTIEDFDRIRMARSFPKSLLHTTIADKIYSALLRGDLDDAVFAAFKAVEVAVRAAGNYKSTDIGMVLVRKAFDPKNGPLTDHSQPEAEKRSAICSLAPSAPTRTRIRIVPSIYPTCARPNNR